MKHSILGQDKVITHKQKPVGVNILMSHLAACKDPWSSSIMLLQE
jgi:hypothetical protein